MLKTCFECLVGTNNNPVEHDTYGTRLNGHTQTTMSSTENEDIFNLPRPLKSNDIIRISGNFSENRGILLFKLQSGTPQQSYQAFQIEVDFLQDTITITDNNGLQKPNSLKPSRILNNSKFSLFLQVIEMPNGIQDTILIDINMGNVAIDTVEVDSNMLENITFFTLTYGVVQVTDLAFTYA